MAAEIPSLDIEIYIEKIGIDDSEELALFSCGNEVLDDFFHQEILVCAKYHYVSAYCAREVSDGKIVAIFTLANDAVVLDNAEDKEDFIQESSAKIQDEYLSVFQLQTSFPAINIGHLGVRVDKQGKRIGEQVLDFILTTFASFDMTGCQFITVDSLNNSRTNKFYTRNHFLYQTQTDMHKPTRRMYLPIELYRV